MTATEQQVKMAAKLYEMRDTAKRLLGDVYRQRMAEMGGLLMDAAEHNGITPLAAAIRLCKSPNLSATDTLMVMAAAVELAEPSA